MNTSDAEQYRAEEAIARLLGHPQGVHYFSKANLPPDAEFIKGPLGSLVYREDWMQRHFRHWYRKPGPQWTLPRAVSGTVWGSMCKICNRGFESSNNSTAVQNILHSQACSINHEDGYYPKEEMHSLVRDLVYEP